MVVDTLIPMWLYPVIVWMIIWKAIASWKAARKGHLIWFVSFFVFNTFGVLPIAYILFFQNMKVVTKKSKAKKVSKKKVKAPTL